MWTQAKKAGVPLRDLKSGDTPSEGLKRLPFNDPLFDRLVHDSMHAIKDPVGYWTYGIYARQHFYPEGCP